MTKRTGSTIISPEQTTMKATSIRSLAVLLLPLAAAAQPSGRVEADTQTTALRSGCSHLRYSPIAIAARDGARLYASDFNNKGEVVGLIVDDSNGINEAVLWKDGDYERLGDRVFAGALTTFVAAINDRTQIVGEFVTPDFDVRSYLLDKRGVTYLAGDFFSPQEINDRGEVVGMASSGGFLHGVVWRNGETLLLPLAPGHVVANTVDINNKGTVVGIGAAPEINSEALVWFPPYVSAPTIIRLPADAISSPNVAAVNNRDQVIFSVGLQPAPGANGDGVTRSFVWEAGRPLQALEPLPGYTHSSAVDINSAGVVVGTSISAGAEFTAATLWRNGQTCELQELVRSQSFEGEWIYASDVNERGEILAFLDQSPIGAGWFVLRPTHAQY